jgi:SNF2 family DNA or RNA helicase
LALNDFSKLFYVRDINNLTMSKIIFDDEANADKKKVLITFDSDSDDAEEEPGAYNSDDSESECDDECDENEEEEITIPTTSFTPLQHQHPALRWIKNRENRGRANGVKGGILALAPGLGKTFLSLYHISKNISNEGSRTPTLIVGTKSCLYTWKSEIEKFFGSTMKLFIFRNDNPRVKTITINELLKYHVILTNYEYLRTLANKYKVYEKVGMRDISGRFFGANTPNRPALKATSGDALMYSIRWDRIVADESHTFSNYKTSIWRSVISLCSEFRLCLSGTPIKNSSEDLYAQYKFLGYYEPEFNIKEFHKLNLSEYIYYADYKIANVKLPESTYIKVDVDVDKNQEIVYNEFLRHTRQEFKNFSYGTSNFASVFTLFLRLRQILVAPYTITIDSSNLLEKGKINQTEYEKSQKQLDKMSNGLSTWIRNKDGTAGINAPKLNKIVDIIRTIPKGEKTVVFTVFKRVIDLLKEKIDNTEGLNRTCITVDGSVAGVKRDMAIDAFKNTDIDILLISYKIGAESLNLTEANNIILAENWWNDSTCRQATARVSRLGQKNKVKIFELFIPSTDTLQSIEDAMKEIREHKREIANSYLTEGKYNGAKLDKKTMAKILAVRKVNTTDTSDNKGKKTIKCEGK